MPTSDGKDQPDIAEQISDMQSCIMRNEGYTRRNTEYIRKVRAAFADTEHLVSLHADDIKMIMGLVQALAMRIGRIEEQLGITEPVEVPGD